MLSRACTAAEGRKRVRAVRTLLRTHEVGVRARSSHLCEGAEREEERRPALPHVARGSNNMAHDGVDSCVACSVKIQSQDTGGAGGVRRQILRPKQQARIGPCVSQNVLSILTRSEVMPRLLLC